MDIILVVYFLMWHFLVILACLFTLSGLDDLFIDIYFWVRYLLRIRKTRHYEPLTYEKLLKMDEKMIAVLVPCWHEANVIATMLKHNCYSIDYQHFYFFVGVYPNDPATVAEVENVAKMIKQVQCVIGEKPGPTNKAANLNGIYTYIKEFEKKISKQFEIFVFHDSEDVIHPLSFKLYNYLIPRKDMIQIPVFPLEVNHFNFTHWLYADEFSEGHTKDIVVREAIHAHVPSAGVGTAFSRRALNVLEDEVSGLPFSIDSLTEDYRTSLALRMHQLKQIFVTQTITRMRWKKRGFFRPKYVQRPMKEYIATRALFPVEYIKAVRQKARWIIGIVFQEWDHSLWPKDWKIRYTLLHDRKSFITHFINGFGYCVLMFWLVYSWVTANKPEYPSLQEQFNAHPWVWWLSVAVSMIMVERIIQRMIAVHRIYGWKPVWLVLPRVLYGNVLNLHALIRAYYVYFSAAKQGKKNSRNQQPKWDKTEHHFPGRHVLVPYRRKLGDLLLDNGFINPQQLYQALIEQEKSGERLGEILVRLNMMTKACLLKIIASQYDLKIFPETDIAAAKEACWPLLSKRTVKWLKKYKLIPVSVDKAQNKIRLVIEDPTNELLLTKSIRFFSSWETEFVLLA